MNLSFFIPILAHIGILISGIEESWNAAILPSTDNNSTSRSVCVVVVWWESKVQISCIGCWKFLPIIGLIDLSINLLSKISRSLDLFSLFRIPFGILLNA